MLASVALHAVACVAVRVSSPGQAARLIRACGRLFFALDDDEATRDAVRLKRLGRLGVGTCLTRALTVAARARGAEVVLGVNPAAPNGDFAHAWVVRNGRTLTDVGGYEPIAHIGQTIDPIAARW